MYGASYSSQFVFGIYSDMVLDIGRIPKKQTKIQMLRFIILASPTIFVGPVSWIRPPDSITTSPVIPPKPTKFASAVCVIVVAAIYNYDFWKTTMVSYMSEKIRWKKYWDRHHKHLFAHALLIAFQSLIEIRAPCLR